jgi:hypothetical protein
MDKLIETSKNLPIDSVDRLIEELERVAPYGMGPGFSSSITIRNAHIWRIVSELKRLRKEVSNEFIDSSVLIG